jgi:hypothetical protein
LHNIALATQIIIRSIPTVAALNLNFIILAPAIICVASIIPTIATPSFNVAIITSLRCQAVQTVRATALFQCIILRTATCGINAIIRAVIAQTATATLVGKGPPKARFIIINNAILVLIATSILKKITRNICAIRQNHDSKD